MVVVVVVIEMVVSVMAIDQRYPSDGRGIFGDNNLVMETENNHEVVI